MNTQIDTKNNIQTKIILAQYLVFIVALVATFGSLFFSEVMKFPPCDLCWLQRVFMYPIAAIALVGILLQDKNVFYYVSPLTFIGLTISIYHNLIYFGIIERIVPCSAGVSCTSVHILWFGFLTIPLMSLIAFTIITTLTLYSVLIFNRSVYEK